MLFIVIMPELGYCSICRAPNSKEINAQLLLSSQHEIARNFDLNRVTLRNHVQNCLKLESNSINLQSKIRNFDDANEVYQGLVRKGNEAIAAARNVLTVNSELSMHPKSWELQVVYQDYNDLDELGRPKQKVDMLDDLLRKLMKAGYQTKKSHSNKRTREKLTGKKGKLKKN